MNSMSSLLEQLGQQAADALRNQYGTTQEAIAAIPNRISIEISNKSDYQTAAALQLAKNFKCPPKEVAQIICNAISKSTAVAETSIAGPGFVNIQINDAWLLANADHADHLRPVGAGQTVVIDYSSPNV